MNIWMIEKKINETLLREKEDFFSHLSMEDITDADYLYTKKVCKVFKTKYLGEYYDLYVQSNIHIRGRICHGSY